MSKTKIRIKKYLGMKTLKINFYNSWILKMFSLFMLFLPKINSQPMHDIFNLIISDFNRSYS